MPQDLDKRLLQRVLNKIRRKVDFHESEDALHSAYLKLRRYSECQSVENPEAFLLRAARNLAIDGYRRRGSLSGGDFEVECAHLADISPLQDEVFETRARLLLVQKGLEQLPPRTRQIFEMHRLDSLKYREIAERLGISQSAVEKHIARAALLIGKMAKEWEE